MKILKLSIPQVKSLGIHLYACLSRYAVMHHRIVTNTMVYLLRYWHYGVAVQVLALWCSCSGTTTFFYLFSA